MDVIVLGPISSASTWVFNVVRMILASQGGKRVCSVFAEEASVFLANVTRPYDDCVVKAHYLDAGFLALAESPSCRIVSTSREAIDIVASAQTRFGYTPAQTLQSLSRSVATMRQLPRSDSHLPLSYERGFTGRASTVDEIAKFLGVALRRDAAERIFCELQQQKVKTLLDARARSPVHAFHPSPHHASQWHIGHVDNAGASRGKEALSDTVRQTVKAVSALVDWRPDPPSASAHARPDLFQYTDHFADEDGHVVYCDGSGRHVVYGPYLHLPPGLWEAKFRLCGVDDSPPLRLSVDVMADLRLAAATCVVAPERAQDAVLAFDHFDHLLPVEFRIESLPDARIGKFKFLGVELTYKSKGQRDDYRLGVCEPKAPS